MDKKIIVVSIFIMLLLSGWIMWGNTALMTTKITIENSKLPENFDGFRIVQISDLHNTEFGDENKKLLAMIQDCEPDMVVITGDLIDSRKTDVDIAISFAEIVVKIAPTYYVTGNHEALSEKYAELSARLERVGVLEIKDESVVIERFGEEILLVGIQDPYFYQSQVENGRTESTADILAELVCTENFTILLSHRPELFETYVESQVDLVFSGHAHGGQFRLPFVGGLVAPDQGLFPKYDAGLYEKEGTSMVVSRGIGNSIIPVRINNRPEIVLVELQKAQ